MVFHFKTPFGADFKDKLTDEDIGTASDVAQPAQDELKDGGKHVPEKETVLDGPHSYIISVVMFVIGLFILAVAIFPGNKGWIVMHEFTLGMFGVSAFILPPVLIAASVFIGLRKDGKRIKRMIRWSIILAVLVSSTVQIVFVGHIPGDGVLDNVSKLYDGGRSLKGGGVLSLIMAGPFIALFGRIGAVFVMLLLIIVLLAILTGKNIVELWQWVSKPFGFLGEFFDGVKNILMGVDFNDDFEDEDDDFAELADEKERRAFNKDLEAIEIVNHKEKSPDPEFIPESERAQEQDEFSRLFDIKLPDEPTKQLVDMPDEGAQDSSDKDLDVMIDEAAKTAERKKASNKIELTKKPEPVQSKLYILPGIDLLTAPKSQSNSKEAAQEMREKADIIVNTLRSFRVEVKIRSIYRGPSITRYEIQPGVGVKVSKIKSLEDDIALSLASVGVRIEAPVPGKAAVGIEVPNRNRDTVTLREILASEEFRNSPSKLAFAVGKDITGNAIVGDISKMPHVIIAGTTGSGKSVCTRSIIMSILYNANPDEVKLILIDPKVVEFKLFEGIPHLLIPIVTDVKKAAGALNWAVNEMMRRYNTFAEAGANDLKSYNEYADKNDGVKRMPQIVVFIDELADMMLVAGKEVEDSICRLAQMGRAAGMHLVVATQRPTTDVITGLIKANIPSRIALSVKSQVDSRTIIDMAGADRLLGNGDMLYMPIGTNKPVRIQGCFASNNEINKTLDFIRAQAVGEYDKSIVDAVDNYVPQTKGGDHGGSSGDSGFEAGSDEDYVIRAAEVAVNAGQVSTTMLQKKLKLGYARASRILDELEERGIVGPPEGSRPRKVLMSKMQFDEWKLRKLEDI